MENNEDVSNQIFYLPRIKISTTKYIKVHKIFVIEA